MEKWHNHIGVYGIARKENKILVIRKNKGPYKGLYDLPGGSIDSYCSLENNLKREWIEETGYQIKVLKTCGSFDYLTKTPYQDANYTHHIAMFYDVEIIEKVSAVNHFLLKENMIEVNDSLGAYWTNLDQIDMKECSPLLITAIELIKNHEKRIMDMKMKNWP